MAPPHAPARVPGSAPSGTEAETTTRPSRARPVPRTSRPATSRLRCARREISTFRLYADPRRSAGVRANSWQKVLRLDGELHAPGSQVGAGQGGGHLVAQRYRRLRGHAGLDGGLLDRDGPAPVVLLVDVDDD